MNPERKESPGLLSRAVSSTGSTGGDGDRGTTKVYLLGRIGGAFNKIDWRIIVVFLLAVLAIPLWRAVSHRSKPSQTGPSAILEPATAPLPVTVARVTRADLFNEDPIPAEFRPYQEVELHAKVSGYVQQINVDFGDKVKAGQLLAKLEVPELQDELHRAMATLHHAEADYTNAHLIYTRYTSVEKTLPMGVSPADVDAARAKDAATEAAIGAAKADVEKYQTLLGYTRITAPFDGVITHRYADPGALIQSGTASDTQSLPLVRVSDNYHLRLDFPVSVAYVKDIHIGDPVDVRVESLGRSLTGTIVRTTMKVNAETRTMITEIEVPNPTLELVPGMYCRVLLKVDRHPNALTIPIDAAPPGYTTSVYVVNDRNQIEERPVTLGIDTPTQWEVVSGLKEGEMVLTSSRSVVRPGQLVQPKPGSLVNK